MGIISTSGVVVGLVFGFSRFVTPAAPLTSTEHVLLVIGLLAFGVAAGLGLACGWPVPHLEAKTEDLLTLTDPDDWKQTEDAQRLAADLRVKLLHELRRVIERKAGLLSFAMASEFVAILLVVVVGIIVLGSD